MRKRIPVLVVGLVVCEAIVFVLVGRAFGFLPTLGLGLLSMIAGAVLLRRQGLATLLRMRAETAAGQVPAKTLLEGAVLALAALLMILPGFLTDMAGILLFIPAVRSFLGRRIRDRVAVGMARRGVPRPAPAAVVDLDPSQYAFEPRTDSPWRRDEAER